MSTNRVLPAVVLWTLAGISSAFAQSSSPFGNSQPVVGPVLNSNTPTQSYNPAVSPYSPANAIINQSSPLNPVSQIEPVSPSAQAWQQNAPAYCCGPFGANGPIGSELFLYTGPTIPVSGGTLFHQLHTGWMVEWGVRSLFFNTDRDAAWGAKVSGTYAYNGGLRHGGPTFSYFGIPVRVRDLDRWSFTIGASREWFLFGSRDNGESNLRFGLETGGRWGTEHVNLLIDIFDPRNQSNYLRRQDVFGAYYLGTHIDYEIPMGAWVFLCGFRAEYNWDFDDILPGNSSLLRDVNLLFSIGVRY